MASRSESSCATVSRVGMTRRVCETPSSASACVTLGAMAALGTGSLKERKNAGW